MDDILGFWFGTLDELGRAPPEHSARWWKRDPAFDAEIRERFLADHQAIAAGERAAWQDEARGALATVVVLDQFSRNLFRDTHRVYDYDERALAAALRAIDRGFDRELPLDMRTFFYMPLMHSEDLAMQDRCVGLFEAMRGELDGVRRERIEGYLVWAKKHREVVATFGRFPHRNPLLGRTSTGAEMQYMLEPGSGF